MGLTTVATGRLRCRRARPAGPFELEQAGGLLVVGSIGGLEIHARPVLHRLGAGHLDEEPRPETDLAFLPPAQEHWKIMVGGFCGQRGQVKK
ncbi:hypothetical protein GCM10010112_78120 [Actinoplanes lobatus]|uniref:Uncharacterized protein n=1 Tax=Actinoplanes lobatus TaxID=113568 RepID=A0ABQ4AAP2_9ACTN|nr:hypothetical protein GCM10010112_78120 [Actinoplanes lobatus]GIE38053.1 hypothetical protein Alo02nite_09510 [Actinoplanes lobatus]